MLQNACPEPRDCDFEDSVYPYCTWLHYSNSLEWAIKSQIAPLYPFLPSVDHTFKNETGRYIYLTNNGNNLLFGANSILFSQQYPPTNQNGFCMTFYYQIKGGLNINKIIYLVLN